MNRTLFRTAILASSLPLLGGCVAALVPVVASGALIGKQQLESKDDARDDVIAVEDSATPEPVQEIVSAPDPEPAPVAAASEPVAEEQVAELPVAELPASQDAIPAEQTAGIERPSPDFIGPVDLEQGEVKLAAAAPNEVPPVAPAAAPTVTPTAPARPAAEPAQFEAAFAPPPNAIKREAPDLSAVEPVQIAMGEPPTPAPAAHAVATAPSGPTDFRAYDALYGYVESQARRDPVQSPRQSALLAAPGSLSPIRTDCSIRPPAIVIDLDPGDQPINTAITPQANPALGQILTSFRLQDIEIFWISRQSAIEAGAIRKALVASGLDPQGRDGLLLMRRADDRKQARRKELSETHCLLAIGGDTRADFDELYLYLKDESTAQPLEELIGAGWFLTPLPLTEGQ